MLYKKVCVEIFHGVGRMCGDMRESLFNQRRVEIRPFSAGGQAIFSRGN